MDMQIYHVLRAIEQHHHSKRLMREAEQWQQAKVARSPQRKGIWLRFTRLLKRVPTGAAQAYSDGLPETSHKANDLLYERIAHGHAMSAAEDSAQRMR